MRREPVFNLISARLGFGFSAAEDAAPRLRSNLSVLIAGAVETYRLRNPPLLTGSRRLDLRRPRDAAASRKYSQAG